MCDAVSGPNTGAIISLNAIGKQDTTKMGKIAAKQILTIISDKNKPRIAETITVDTYLINGETTRVLR